MDRSDGLRSHKGDTIHRRGHVWASDRVMLKTQPSSMNEVLATEGAEGKDSCSKKTTPIISQLMTVV